ncbi:hypothetical protein XENTR_v10004239 [Xenopus tropicalis]|nr:hypothetical protein XENTR_v10004239 [Xenopus tropicalis]
MEWPIKPTVGFPATILVHTSREEWNRGTGQSKPALETWAPRASLLLRPGVWSSGLEITRLASNDTSNG